MRSAALPALVASLALWAGTAAPAFAQATTGTGGGPTSTVTAPNTSATGRTMPPAGGDAGAATAGEPRGKRTQEQKVDDKITRGICIGCGPK
ncbi:hypothetical protein [Methylobacterium persicinum]|uniref:Uncharacterized protein n=1 Tax=Methylobacterium persicinum TaxID=374426 RepID=A0ABU0HRI6_9HYPH|nr:hypothetical protein [Methylobacterium persicinum]MDQ0444948.1 hypothetical protein [Methylobacterium persicinum]GJE40352.1 hypothetical protein KHHGKMAE_4444 [Methylobacterium persicinum]